MIVWLCSLPTLWDTTPGLHEVWNGSPLYEKTYQPWNLRQIKDALVGFRCSFLVMKGSTYKIGFLRTSRYVCVPFLAQFRRPNNGTHNTLPLMAHRHKSWSGWSGFGRIVWFILKVAHAYYSWAISIALALVVCIYLSFWHIILCTQLLIEMHVPFQPNMALNLWANNGSFVYRFGTFVHTLSCL